ncbi:ABC transporter substrate-binding protein [Deinococcus aquiradiocola]|uniref:Cobalamin-binding protein n=1 Tax=Deinococcus aquiradiocola TaxID=393059 RepID=A0A917P4E8_9DEIO|nr:ABC transporter substrate-binding protein [Deinococcus aquiradiocola]GGJ61210.1 cobalamin-binding protein [Deinococcus aquiradiocola]
MRIASLHPTATRILRDLGVQGQLVGVSHACRQPDGAPTLPVLTRRSLHAGLSPLEAERVLASAMRGGWPLHHVRAEALAEVCPDLIVTEGPCRVQGDAPGGAAAPLEEALPDGAVLLNLRAGTVAGVLRDVQAVARATRLPDGGEDVLRRARHAWSAVKPVRHAPRVLTLEWPEPACVGGHWVPEQVRRAGGRAVLATPGGTPRHVSWDDVRTADPDVIVMMCCGEGLSGNEGFARNLRAHPALSTLRAVQDGQVWAVDAAEHFSYATLGIVRGAAVLASVLAGQDLPGESRRVTA